MQGQDHLLSPIWLRNSRACGFIAESSRSSSASQRALACEASSARGRVRLPCKTRVRFCNSGQLHLGQPADPKTFLALVEDLLQGRPPSGAPEPGPGAPRVTPRRGRATWTGAMPRFWPRSHVPRLPAPSHAAPPDGQDPFWVTRRWQRARCPWGSPSPGQLASQPGFLRPPASRAFQDQSGWFAALPLPWAGPPCLLSLPLFPPSS